MNDNEKQPIFKGRITEFGPETDAFGAHVSARVAPATTPDAPTRLFPILYIARDPRCDLAIDTEVVCARFEDDSGIILGRADGEYTHHFPGDAHFDKGGLPSGDVHVEDSLDVLGDASVQGSVTVGGSVGASGDVTGAGVSLAGHTHTGTHGETSGPH